MTIKNKLIFSFAIVLLIPCLTIGWMAYQTAKNKIEEEMMNTANGNVQLLDEFITELITNRKKDVEMLSENISSRSIRITPGSTAGQDPLTERSLTQYQKAHPEVELAYVGTETGAFLHAPASSKMPSDYDPRNRPWYQEAMKHKGSVIITSPYLSKAAGNSKETGDLVITVAKTTQDGGGVAAVNINLDELQKVAKKVKIGKSGYVYILSQDRKYLVHPTAGLGTEALKNVQNDNLYKSDSGTFEYVFKDGTNKKMVFITNKRTGWKLAGTMSSDEISAEASGIFTRTLLVLGSALFLGAILVYFIIASIHRPLQKIIESATHISEGNLTGRIEITKNDEVGKLGQSFNKMIDSLSAVIVEVNQKSSQLAAASEQLAASAEQSSKAGEHIALITQEVATGSDNQMRTVEENAKFIGEISEGINEVAANSKNVTSTAIQTSEEAKEGNEIIQAASTRIYSLNESIQNLSRVVEGLGERSLEIDQITTVIRDISSQTNLLALNAAIEAARAGEHGRGFAVVADEVRKLAEQSAQSTEQISHLITSIQQETDQAILSMKTATAEASESIATVNKAGEVFQHIYAAVDEVSSRSKEAASILTQLSAGAAQTVHVMDEITKVAEESAEGTQTISAAAQEQLASMEEITSSAAHLSQMAEGLQRLVEKFKV